MIDNAKIPFVPESWECLLVKNAIDKILLTKRKLKQKEYLQEGKLPVVDQGQELIGGYTDNEEMKVSAETPLIIFGDHTRVFKYIPFDFVAGADGIKVLKPKRIYLSKLLYYILQSVRFPYKGYARHYQYLEKSYIPLPPLPEQYRIVAKIEELFTRLDAGVSALKQVQAQLKRYRQSVLKAAVEGNLTAEWREQHKDELEPADKLLERIKEEQKAKIGNKYKDPIPIDTNDLPELPERWVWVKLGTICEDILKINPKEKPIKQFTYLDIASIDNTEGKITSPKYYSGKDAPSRARQVVKSGDILFSTVRTYLKNIAIVEDVYDGQIASTGFCVIRPILASNKYLFYLTSRNGFINQLSKIQRGTSYPAVRNSDVVNQVIAFPPLKEQVKIAEAIDRLFSIADEVDSLIKSELKRAQSLRQLLLKRAFEGKLVLQNPDDEPASVLLERIKAEKATSKKYKQLELL